MMKKFFSIVATAFFLSQVGCSAESKMTGGPAPLDEPKELPATAKVAYFAAGCFWCSEEIFQQQPGVISVTSGFMGGTYQMVQYMVPILKSKGYTWKRVDEVPDIASLLPNAKVVDGGAPGSSGGSSGPGGTGSDTSSTEPNPCP